MLCSLRRSPVVVHITIKIHCAVCAVTGRPRSLLLTTGRSSVEIVDRTSPVINPKKPHIGPTVKKIEDLFIRFYQWRRQNFFLGGLGPFPLPSLFPPFPLSLPFPSSPLSHPPSPPFPAPHRPVARIVKTRRQTGRAPIPSPPLPALPSPPLRSRPPKIQLGRLGERCKLPQRGLGRSPIRNRFWCILA